MEQREFVVEQETAGQRIDRFLSGEDTGLSRSALQALVADGHVQCNGKTVAKSLKLKAGDTVLLEIPDAKPIEAVPQEIPLDIVYEDAHLLVVNKPKGMVVHPAPGNPDGTLVNALLWHCKGSLSGIGGEIRPGIVHRIDKDTSGLLVVAKDDATHIGLSQQMAVHSVERAYNTIVYGGFAQDEGFVESNLGRSKTDRKKMAVYPAGEPNTKYAYTGYKVLERLGEFTMLECRLKTGRTHQIQPARAVSARQNAGVCPPHHRGTPALRLRPAGLFYPFSCNAQEEESMNQSLANKLVLCDLDNLLLGPDGNLTQVVRDVLQLFSSRGGRFTVFSQRTPKAVRALLGSVRLSAPALVCGGTLAYHFADGSRQPLCSFAGQDAGLFASLPSAAGVGIALQMQDGSTRVLRMSHALEQHLQQEWTPYLLANAADIRPDEVLRALVYQDNRSIPLTSLLEKALGGSTTALLGERAAPDLLRLTPRTVSGAEMLQAVCTPVGIAPENVLVLAGSMPMLELVRAASRSAAAADAPAELRLAAKQVTLTDAAGGAAVEVLYRMVRDAEKLA